MMTHQNQIGVFSICIGLVLSIFGCNSDGNSKIPKGHVQDDVQNQGFKGSVKQVVHTFWGRNDDSLALDSSQNQKLIEEERHSYHFSESRTLLMEEWWQQGKKEKLKRYLRDSSNFLQEEITESSNSEFLAQTSYLRNDFGALLEQQVFHKDKRLIRKTTYFYDFSGGPYRETEFVYRRKGEGNRVSWKNEWEREYFPDSSLSKVLEYLDDKVSKVIFYEAGKVVGEHFLERNGKIKRRNVYEYGPQARTVTEFNESNTVLKLHHFQEDSSGNLIQSAIYRPDSFLISMTRYKRDLQGRCTEESAFYSYHDAFGEEHAADLMRPPNLEEEIIFETDKKGNLILKTVYSKGKTIRRERWVFSYF